MIATPPRPPRPGARPLIGALLATWLICGVVCAETDCRLPEPLAPRHRVISFSPALTQIVVDLGRANWLVAAAQHDAAAPPALPVIGNQWQPNVERLLALKPTLVLVMTAKEGVHPRLADLAAAGQFTLWTRPIPSSAQEAIDAIDGGDTGAGLAEVLAVADRGGRLAGRLRRRLDQLNQLSADRPQRRVLLVIGTNPLWASGPRSVEDDLLRYVGAINAAGDAAGRAAAIDREKLVAISPEIVVLLGPGDPPLQPLGEDRRLAIFERLDIPATANRRFHLIDDPRCMLIQGSGLGPIAIELAKAIHPDLAEPIDALTQADDDPPMGATEEGPPHEQ